VVSGLPNITPIFSQLVDEDERGLRLGGDGGELAGACDMRRAWRPTCASPIAFDPRAARGGDRVDHDHVNRVRAHEHFDDLERLFAVVGLRHEQVFDIHAELAGVFRVERGVDERMPPAAAPRR
jgi:hypothetical protein